MLGISVAGFGLVLVAALMLATALFAMTKKAKRKINFGALGALALLICCIAMIGCGASAHATQPELSNAFVITETPACKCAKCECSPCKCGLADQLPVVTQSLAVWKDPTKIEQWDLTDRVISTNSLTPIAPQFSDRHEAFTNSEWQQTIWNFDRAESAPTDEPSETMGFCKKRSYAGKDWLWHDGKMFVYESGKWQRYEKPLTQPAGFLKNRRDAKAESCSNGSCSAGGCASGSCGGGGRGLFGRRR